MGVTVVEGERNVALRKIEIFTLICFTPLSMSCFGVQQEEVSFQYTLIVS